MNRGHRATAAFGMVGPRGQAATGLIAALLACAGGHAMAQAPERPARDSILSLPPLQPMVTTDLPPALAPLPPPAPPPTLLPPLAPAPQPASATAAQPTAPAPANAKTIPISFDAVLRLAQDQNAQVRLAREKLQEAIAEHEIAHKRWLPDIYLGAGYWRHEGGIQDFYGNIVRSNYGSALLGGELRGKLDVRDVVFQRLNAERRIWQKQGELSKFTSEQLLDAASTYIDWLAARAAETVALEMEVKLQRLLDQARSLEKVDPGVRVEAMRVEAELQSQKILTRRLREGANDAAAKLAYILDLDADSELVPLDRQLVAFRLVDTTQPVGKLVQTALERGPGVQELTAILSVVESMRAKCDSPLMLMPTFEVHLAEGAFGAGPGARTEWANRFDLGLQARWNLTELLTSRQKRRIGDSQVQQMHLTYHDLRGKLTLGVKEAREAALSGAEQIQLATRQIEHAEESYQLSDMRLRENIKGRSPSEVLLAIRALVAARLSYVHALRDHDKAQVRLFILTGSMTAARGAVEPRRAP